MKYHLLAAVSLAATIAQAAVTQNPYERNMFPSDYAERMEKSAVRKPRQYGTARPSDEQMAYQQQWMSRRAHQSSQDLVVEPIKSYAPEDQNERWQHRMRHRDEDSDDRRSRSREPSRSPQQTRASQHMQVRKHRHSLSAPTSTENRRVAAQKPSEIEDDMMFRFDGVTTASQSSDISVSGDSDTSEIEYNLTFPRSSRIYVNDKDRSPRLSPQKSYIMPQRSWSSDKIFHPGNSRY